VPKRVNSGEKLNHLEIKNLNTKDGQLREKRQEWQINSLR
tara:strand:- start:607 stop:726 length:120 start_codon:yes stop_codon:yes gene_type:complete